MKHGERALRKLVSSSRFGQLNPIQPISGRLSSTHLISAHNSHSYPLFRVPLSSRLSAEQKFALDPRAKALIRDIKSRAVGAHSDRGRACPRAHAPLAASQRAPECRGQNAPAHSPLGRINPEARRFELRQDARANNRQRNENEIEIETTKFGFHLAGSLASAKLIIKWGE